jgi:hypothetical protein
LEVSQDVRFEEELAFMRSQERIAETDGEDKEALKVEERACPSSTGIHPSDHEEESKESVDPLDFPGDEDMRPRWLQDTLRYVEKQVAPNGTFRESRHS